MNKTLVAYFSTKGVTAEMAKYISEITKGDLYEIEPEVHYTDDDLNWNNSNSRSSIEMKDLVYRPKVVDNKVNMDEYDTIYVGFPIWWYIAPTIINTFLESYDFSSKTIILFATSGGSGFGKAVDNLKPSVSSSTVIKEGLVIKGRPTLDKVKQWLIK